jgi:hypothetical protein
MLAHNFFEIAKKNCELVIFNRKNPVPVPEEYEDWEAHDTQVKETLHASIQCIVFSAMACEAAIYDLAAIHLSDDFARSIDKLDVIGKWMVVPSLICGRALVETGPAMNSLNSLIKVRNKLVHHKSISAIPASDNPKVREKAFDEGRAQMARFTEGALPALEAVILLSLELNRVLGVPTGVLPFFETHITRQSSHQESADIMNLINKCRRTDANNRRDPI